jgi:hypothetical protein
MTAAAGGFPDSGVVASWRGNRDPVVAQGPPQYGGGGGRNMSHFGDKKPRAPIPPGGQPDLSNRRDEFAGFGGMNRIR